MKIAKLIIGLPIAMLYSLVLFAEPVGTLTMADGTLKLRRNRVDTIYQDPGLNIPVERGDEIQTGFKTRATIRMSAQSDSIELFPNTFFTVADVNADETELTMPAGKARFQVDAGDQMKPSKGRRFRLRTANAVIGVKGTRFLVGVVGVNTSLLTLSGIVSLASIAAPDVAIEVRANQASRVQANQAPLPPVIVPPEVQQKISESDDAESFNEAGFGDEPQSSMTDPQTAATADEDLAGEVDSLIEETSDQIDEIQEDVSNTTSNRRSVTFTIVDK